MTRVRTMQHGSRGSPLSLRGVQGDTVESVPRRLLVLFGARKVHYLLSETERRKQPVYYRHVAHVASIRAAIYAALLPFDRRGRLTTRPSFRRTRSPYMPPYTPSNYSHSTVAGGLLVISYTTRLICPTSLTTRVETFSRTSYGIRAQSAVIPSTLVTARSASI